MRVPGVGGIYSLTKSGSAGGTSKRTDEAALPTLRHFLEVQP